MLFPGAYWYTRKAIENNVGLCLAKAAHPKFIVLKTIVDRFMDGSETRPFRKFYILIFLKNQIVIEFDLYVYFLFHFYKYFNKRKIMMKI